MKLYMKGSINDQHDYINIQGIKNKKTFIKVWKFVTEELGFEGSENEYNYAIHGLDVTGHCRIELNGSNKFAFTYRTREIYKDEEFYRMSDNRIVISFEEEDNV